MRSLLFILLTSWGLMASVTALGNSANGKPPGAWAPGGNQEPTAPAAAQPQAPAQPASVEGQTLESQPPMAPTSQPGQDQFEKNPAETVTMICEQAELLRTTEAQLAQAQDAVSKQSFAELVASRKRELKAVMSVYKRQTGRRFDLATQCAQK